MAPEIHRPSCPSRSDRDNWKWRHHIGLYVERPSLLIENWFRKKSPPSLSARRGLNHNPPDPPKRSHPDNFWPPNGAWWVRRYRYFQLPPQDCTLPWRSSPQRDRD